MSFQPNSLAGSGPILPILTGSGFPAVPAPVGALYLRTDQVAEQLYVKESGTGTTGWSAVGTSSGTYNVKDYGAVGDGATADYAAIASTIAAAAAVGGGTVYFPPGTYMVGTSIVVPSNVRIVGVDKNSSIIQKTANITLFDFAGASNASRCQRGGMMDIKLVGNGFTGFLVRCKWADHLNFDRVWMFNSPDVMLYTENLWDTYFNNVEFDTAIGADGFKPAVMLTSNADDSTNIIVFNECRWENFVDGACWIASRAPAVAYTPQTGTNPPYGIYFQNCKMETSQLRGQIFTSSSDVGAVQMDGMYVAARGLFAGITTGRTLFSIGNPSDIVIQRMRLRIDGSVNPTVAEAFYVSTNGVGLVIRDILVDANQNPSTAIFNMAGGAPDIEIKNIDQKSGQTATLFAGTWPPQVASATALTIPKLPALIVITGTTTITSITAQIPGRVVTLQFSGALTLTDGSNLKLAGNFVTTADDSITLVCDGTNWIEMARSVN